MPDILGQTVEAGANVKISLSCSLLERLVNYLGAWRALPKKIKLDWP